MGLIRFCAFYYKKISLIFMITELIYLYSFPFLPMVQVNNLVDGTFSIVEK